MKIFKAIIASAALVCLSSTLTFAQSYDDAVDKYTVGIEKLKSGAFQEAIDLFGQAREISIELGDQGTEILKEAQDKMMLSYIQFGVASIKAGQYDKAITELLLCEQKADLWGDIRYKRQASRIISGAYQAKGGEAFNAKDYKTALESFSKGFQQDPSNIKLALLTAKSYAELGDLDQALPIFDNVIETGRSNSKFEVEAAEAIKDVATYVGVAVSAAAEAKDMDKVISLANLVPNNADVALLTMQVANNLQRTDILIERGVKAAELQSNPASKSDIYYMLGIVYNNSANVAKAVEALGKVTQGDNVANAKKLIGELKK